MRTSVVAVMAGLALAAGPAGVASAEPAGPAVESEVDGWWGTVRLFDGRTLRGWSQAGPGGFDVVDGTLQSRGGMGLLWYSDRQFADYELRLEWRATAETDNSGVFLRFPNPGTDPWVAVHRGYEVQINDNPAGDPQKTGAIYNFKPPIAKASKLIGQWNAYRIRVTGERYQVWLNGVLVNDFTSTDPNRGTRGYVGLQNHDPNTKVQFRRITVRQLC